MKFLLFSALASAASAFSLQAPVTLTTQLGAYKVAVVGKNEMKA